MEADASTLDMPSDCCYFVEKAAAAGAAPAFQYFDSIFHHFAVVTQNLGQTLYTFGRFVNEVWIPLCVRDGSHRPATVAMYTNILKLILPRFEDYLIHEITAVQISQYLVWLRNEYRTARGKPLAEKSIRHHYNILSMIFNYAEKQDIVTKSPMKKVDAPKVSRKAVDALSEKEAERFFIALGNCSLDFRCILQVLITTGLRRGECIGLQWQDIDFQNATLKVQRSATYTPETGVVVSEPKTPNSIRTIPVMKSTLALLKQLQKEQMAQHPTTILSRAFVFPSEDSLFEPRDPNAVTKHMKRFIRAAGLPDVSPHDLRHTSLALIKLLNSSELLFLFFRTKLLNKLFHTGNGQTRMLLLVLADICGSTLNYVVRIAHAAFHHKIFHSVRPSFPG